MNVIAVSVRSNFIGMEHITAFHSVMFQGVAGRCGKRFPHDSPPAWDEEPNPLELAVNTRTSAVFTVPGYYPVVSSDIHELFSEYPNVRAGAVSVTKCIDVPWSTGSAPAISEDAKSYFDDPSHQCECPESQTDRVELILRQLASATEERRITVETELGTGRLSKCVSLDVPEGWLTPRCAFASGRNFFFDESVFNKIASFVPSDFFVIRDCKVF